MVSQDIQAVQTIVAAKAGFTQLACYVGCTAPIRRTEQVFVCLEVGVAAKALSKNKLARWLCEIVTQT